MSEFSIQPEQVLSPEQKEEIRNKFERIFRLAVDTVRNDLENLAVDERTADIFNPDKRAEVIRHVEVGLKERGTEVKDIEKYFARFVRNVQFEKRFYFFTTDKDNFENHWGEDSRENATCQKASETFGPVPGGLVASSVLEILDEHRKSEPRLGGVYTRLRSLFFGGSTDGEKDFLESVKIDQTTVEEDFPAFSFHGFDLLGFPDFAINRFKDLEVDGLVGCDASVFNFPNEKGRRLIIFRMQEMENLDDSFLANQIIHELHHGQSLILERRVFSKAKVDLNSDDGFIEVVKFDVLTIVDELSARAADAGWSDFFRYYNSNKEFYPRLKKEQEELSRKILILYI